MACFHRGAVVAEGVCHDDDGALGKTSWQLPRHEAFSIVAPMWHVATEGKIYGDREGTGFIAGDQERPMMECCGLLAPEHIRKKYYPNVQPHRAAKLLAFRAGSHTVKVCEACARLSLSRQPSRRPVVDAGWHLRVLRYRRLSQSGNDAQRRRHPETTLLCYQTVVVLARILACRHSRRARGYAPRRTRGHRGATPGTSASGSTDLGVVARRGSLSPSGEGESPTMIQQAETTARTRNFYKMDNVK